MLCSEVFIEQKAIFCRYPRAIHLAYEKLLYGKKFPQQKATRVLTYLPLLENLLSIGCPSTEGPQ